MAWPALGSGRLLEANGDVGSRGMTVLDRTRLIGRLPLHFIRMRTGDVPRLADRP